MIINKIGKEEIKSAEAMEALARDLVRTAIESHTKEKALVFTLSGELGSGKTTFTRGAAHYLGAQGTIASPTFIIVRRLSLDASSGYKDMYHVDLYRIKTKEELDQLALDEALSDPRNIVFIEWPEVAKEFIPKEVWRISFKHGETEQDRSVAWSG